jgi:hypothetical protein
MAVTNYSPIEFWVPTTVLLFIVTWKLQNIFFAQARSDGPVPRFVIATSLSQAVMVSDELIRTAILWHEQWHEGLEEASRLYFGERNIPGMLAKLEPLHAMLEKGPQTLKETSFHQVLQRPILNFTPRGKL